MDRRCKSAIGPMGFCGRKWNSSRRSPVPVEPATLLSASPSPSVPSREGRGWMGGGCSGPREAGCRAAAAAPVCEAAQRARLIRGKVYASQKKTDDALSEWEAARRLSPDSPYGREADRLIRGK